MALSSDRFIFDSQNGQFHTSGMANGDSVTGSGSVQSFQQRQAVERNRQVIAPYHTAAVANSYRGDAAAIRRQASDQDDHHKKHKRKHHHSSQIEISDELSSRLHQMHSSRIDFETPHDHSASSGSRPGTPSVQSQPRVSQPSLRPTFREPSSRGYNPYK